MALRIDPMQARRCTGLLSLELNTRTGMPMTARDSVQMTRGPAAMVAALREPRRYPHPVKRVQLLETHISWVLLTGRYAYKLKKPLDLGFLDFSTLEARRRACEEELRLNRRTAPELYLEVVPVTGTEADPRIGGDGPAIDYAVKMAEFPQTALLDRIAARGELRLDQMDALAAMVADFHARVDCAGPQSEFGTERTVIAPARENFAQIRPLIADPESQAMLQRLADWTEREFARCLDAVGTRRRDGFVRECHGDLHLRNLLVLQKQFVAFDCIEFNARFRWIDVMSDVAFLVMDLIDHGLTAHAWRFLDAYLAATGDYGGLAVLRFYCVHRAMVRAKIACLRANQIPEGTPERTDAAREFQGYLRLAQALTLLDRRALVITRGLSGSGKTVLSGFLVEEVGAIRVRSDVERKRLHGLAPEARTGADVGAGIYAPEATHRTYARLREVARAVIEAGFPAVVDAAFLARADRDLFRALARKEGVPFAIAACEAPEPVLRERIAARARARADPSEATLEVLTRQLVTAEPLAPAERTFAVVIDSQRGLESLRAAALAVGARLGIGPWQPAAVRQAA
jgi:aminoglycoside phosphotransferase family enzyme/predicted kinase